MTIRNLDHVFRPKSVALIGASPQAASVGSVLAQNLFGGGFDGPVYPVNPRHAQVHSVVAYPDVASLPAVPDLAVIATPPATVPGIMAELGEAGTKGAIVITAGFAEGGGAEGAALMQQMLDSAKPHLMRVIGPNCVGIMVPAIGLNASFAAGHALPGNLAFVTQSGAIVTAVVEWARSRGIGFSHLVSLGDMSDVDFGDMLDYLAADASAHAILLYVEGITQPRKFMSAARAAARAKPVIVVKAGRHPEGARAVASHTGALAGSDAVADAAFRRAGLLRVSSLDGLFQASETLSRIRPPRGNRLAILTNGGGVGVLATDALIELGGEMAQLRPETIKGLNKVLPRTWSHGNPVDIVGDAPPERYAQSLELLLKDRNVDAILALNCPTAVASSTAAAHALVETYGGRKDPALFTNWLGGDAAEESRRIFAAHGVPTFETPAEAIEAFMQVVQYRRNREALMATPPSVPEDFTSEPEKAKALIRAALKDGREWLSEPEAKQVLAAYDIPVTRLATVKTPEAAAQAAREFDGPVVLKILSPDILHKSDVGGVVLDLDTPQAVREAAEHMLARVRAAQPKARIEGFVVEDMVRRPAARELIVGVSVDAQFGPTVLFGQGGTSVEVVGDTALALPPLDMQLAREVMSRTRVHRLLKGYRDRPAADLDTIALTLIKVSQMVVDLGELTELDINPLLADQDGVIAIDARIRVAPLKGRAQDRLAIRPYPKELEEEVVLDDGRTFLLRPIKAEDEPSLQAGFARLTPEEIRNRFFIPMATLDHLMAARFAQINYDREMALVLTTPGLAGKTELFGVVRLSADPDNRTAEFAVIVRGDVAGHGLGHMLVGKIVDYARARGIEEVYGEVLSENSRMLRICADLGFEILPVEGDRSVVHVTLDLRGGGARKGGKGK